MKGFLIRVWDLILPGWRWLYEPQVGVSTPRGTVSTRGTTMSSPSLLRFVDVWKDYDPGIGPYPIRVALARRTTGWGFHTLRGRIVPRYLRFRPRIVGVVEVWRSFWSGEGNLSSPGAAGPRRWPKGQLSPRAGSISPSQ